MQQRDDRIVLYHIPDPSQLPDNWSEMVSDGLARIEQNPNWFPPIPELRVHPRQEIDSDNKLNPSNRDWRVGGPNPLWALRQMPGFREIIMSPYTRHIDYVEPQYRYQKTVKWRFNRGFHNVATYGPNWVRMFYEQQYPIEVWEREKGLTRKAYTQLLSDLKESPGINFGAMTTSMLADANSAAYNLAVDLAEMKHTIAYARTLVGRTDLVVRRFARAYKALRRPSDIRRFVRYLKKRKARVSRKNHNYKKWASEAPDGLRRAGAVWLEYNYGIRPLMFSWHDIHKAIYQDSAMLFQHFSRFEDVNVHDDVSSGPFDLAYTSSLEGRTFIRQSIDGGSGHTRLNLWIPGALWEGVTLSFVVDWFVSIGDFLNALRPFVGYQQVGGKSLKTTTSILCKASFAGNSSEVSIPVLDENDVDSWVLYREWYETEPLDFIALQTDLFHYFRLCPALESPGIHMRTYMGWRRKLSGIALILTRLKTVK